MHNEANLFEINEKNIYGEPTISVGVPDRLSMMEWAQ